MNKRVIAIAVAAIVAVTGVWYVALWSPQSKSIKNAHNREAAANALQATLRNDIATLKREEAQLPAKQAVLAKLKLALPDIPGLDTVIDNINNAAIGSGVDWQSLTPSKPASYSAGAAAVASPGGTQAINVTMAVNGLYPQLLDFANKLNAMPRLLTVDSFSLTGVGGPTKTTSQISAQIFFVPAAPKVATTPTTVAPAGH